MAVGGSQALAWLAVSQMGAHHPPSVSHSNLMRFVSDESHQEEVIIPALFRLA